MPETVLHLANAVRQIVKVQGNNANTDSVLEALAERNFGTTFDRWQIAMLLLEVLDEQAR
jgi:hypothetical protein